MEVEDTKALVPTGELSALLGISDVEISRLARRRVIPRIQDPEKPKYYLYPALECCAAYIRHLKTASQRDKDRYWKARAAGEKERSHAIATTNALRDGKLLEAQAVESKQRELAHTLKQRLAVIPGRIADAFAENGDRGRIEQVVNAEITAALMALERGERCLPINKKGSVSRITGSTNPWHLKSQAGI